MAKWLECLNNKFDITASNAIPFAIVWAIWKHRNEVIFDYVAVDVMQVMDLARVKLASWIKAKWKHCPFLLSQIVENLDNIRFPHTEKIQCVDVWSPPNGCFVKFNADGASQGNPGVSRIAGVSRNGERKILGQSKILNNRPW